MTHAAPKTAAIWWPNQRAWRTILQVAASGILGLVTFVAGLAVFAPQFVTALEPILPADWYVWLLGAVTFISLLAGALARVMAIPGVNEWLTRHSAFGTAPKGHLTVAPSDLGLTPGLPISVAVYLGPDDDVEQIAARVAEAIAHDTAVSAAVIAAVRPQPTSET